jgi:hypothetical protein
LNVYAFPFAISISQAFSIPPLSHTYSTIVTHCCSLSLQTKTLPWIEWDAELEVVAAKVAAVTEELPKEDGGANVCGEGKEIPNPAPKVAT